MILKNSIIILIACLLFSCSNNKKDQTSQYNSDKSITDKTEGYSEHKNAYFGDLHVHTSWSFDAFIYNVRTTPDDAYNYGKGKAIDHVSGEQIQLGRPLDFMAVTDHAEYMGIMMQMLDDESPIAELEIADRIRNPDRGVSKRAFGEIGISIARNEPKADLLQKEIIQGVWKEIVDAANRHNKPGQFTTFAGYEWTSLPSERSAAIPFARNMHRNVIYRNTNVSTVPFSSFDSQDPEDLWKWMDAERKKGIDLFAIPHNQNMSDGLMYDLKGMTSKKPLDNAYAESRMRNEPIHEVSQIKGTSMTHPDLSPNDEFADFELYPFVFVQSGLPPASQADGSYVRQALRRGVAMQDDLGANPFKFGFIGSSDGHNSASPVEEDNYFGKMGNIDMNPEMRIGNEREILRRDKMSAGGLAAVWATENTRDALFDGLQSKETYATSGTRMRVRFFAGGDIDQNVFDKDDWLEGVYETTVPMGSDMVLQAGQQAQFAVWALKDPEGANLDRVQIIKLWKDNKGQGQEQVFDVAWAGDRKMVNGNVPAIGSTANAELATYKNTIGEVNLSAVWKDPTFDPNQDAAYYVRVLEIPTPRWSAYDAHKSGIAHPEDLVKVIQERAWSSPIWYNAQ